MAIACGLCFPWALEGARQWLREMRGESAIWRRDHAIAVVHGRATHPPGAEWPDIPGQDYAHAWIETAGGYASDWQTLDLRKGHPVPIAEFYASHKMQHCVRYSPEEAVANARSSGHPGPWVDWWSDPEARPPDPCESPWAKGERARTVRASRVRASGPNLSTRVRAVRASSGLLEWTAYGDGGAWAVGLHSVVSGMPYEVLVPGQRGRTSFTLRTPRGKESEHPSRAKAMATAERLENADAGGVLRSASDLELTERGAGRAAARVAGARR